MLNFILALWEKEECEMQEHVFQKLEPGQFRDCMYHAWYIQSLN
jgi:hypothetical protein